MIRYEWETSGGMRHPAQTFLDDVQSERDAISAGLAALHLHRGTDLALIGVAWCRVTEHEPTWHEIQSPDTNGNALWPASPPGNPALPFRPGGDVSTSRIELEAGL